MIKRLFCTLRRHPVVEDTVEESAWAEDLIAGTGRVAYSAWCPVCERRIQWTEAFP